MTPRIRCEIACWNDDLARSRAAYYADRRVENGWCASCGIGSANKGFRQCAGCYKEGRRGH